MDGTLSRQGAHPQCRAVAVRQSDVGVLKIRCALYAATPHGLDDAELVFVRREGRAERAYPLRPLATDDVVVLEASIRLWDSEEPLPAPGVWGLRVRFGNGEAQVPLLAPPYGRGMWPRIMVPTPRRPLRASFSAKRGVVTLHVAEVPPYVEVDRVEVENAALRLDAHLVPERPRAAGEGQLVVRSRKKKDVTVRRPVELIDGRLHGDVHLDALPTEERENWDVYLRLDGEPELRLGAHLDEIHNKKTVFSFPYHSIDSAKRKLTVQPFYTIHNDLSVRVRPVEEGSRSDDTPAEPSKPAKVHRPLGRVAKGATALVLSFVETAGRLRRPRKGTGTGRRKIYFLVTHVFGVNGVNRTVLNLASHLAQDHDVEIISIIRARKRPFFEVDPRVKVTTLLDKVTLRETSQRGLKHRLREILDTRASWMVHEDDPGFDRYSLWLDLKLLQWMHSLEPGVLIAPRVCLNAIAARFARPGVITIGQEHLNFTYRKPLMRQIDDHYAKLNALVVLTEGDETDFRDVLGGTSTRVIRIPNALPGIPTVRADLDSKRIVAVSNYIPQKGLELLITAFDKVAREYPDWHLRVYGWGPLYGDLQRQIREARLHNHVFLMGQTDQLDDELASSSIFVLSSRREGFAIAIIEAMAVGLPVVSFDCPRGPSDIITDGVDGTLVPLGDVDALAEAIIDLIEDPEKRRIHSEAALRRARSYEIDTIGQAWRRTFDELLGSPARRGRRRLTVRGHSIVFFGSAGFAVGCRR